LSQRVERLTEAFNPKPPPEYRCYFRWQGKELRDEDGTHLGWDNDFIESDEDMMRRYPELRGKTGKLVRMLHLRFDDRPYGEMLAAPETGVEINARVPQADAELSEAIVSIAYSDFPLFE
jgi:hypothetical protein